MRYSSIPVRIPLILVLGCGVASGEPVRSTSLVGSWRVVGCETSPKDPADCARGHIVFTTDHVTIDVPAADERKPHPYSVISSASDRVVLKVDGLRTEVTLDAKGEASWRAPGLGGRVGRLSFVKDRH